MSEKEQKVVAIFNKGLRTYITSAGPLPPKQSISLPEKEAEDMKGYFDIVDMDKVAPHANATVAKLKAENAELKAKLAEKGPGPKEPEPEDDGREKAEEPVHHRPTKGSGKGGKKGGK